MVLSAQEYLGPSEEADAEFEKEFAKIITDSSAESRKIDKKAAWWDSAVLAPSARKKRGDDNEGDADGESNASDRSVMKFTVITKRGNKQQVYQSNIKREHGLTCFLDAISSYPFGIYPCGADAFGTAPGQSGAAAAETSRLEL